jgi:5S rRNA maturation endonuclease (ribonuclease M5)
MNTLNKVIDALRAHGSNGRGAHWQCPAHEDRSPSLSVARGDKGVILTCHAGCPTEDVVAALGLTMADLFDEPLPERRERPKTVAQYHYVDEHGTVLLTVKRLEPGYDGERKTFRQYAPDGTPRVSGIRRVLYRLPDVLSAAREGSTVYVVEGEKDADNLSKTGATVTCNIGGAGKWRDDYTTALTGAGEVIVIADRDEPGRRHAQQVADSVRRAGIPVRVLQPAQGKDISDHLAAGLGYDDLKPLLSEAPEPAADHDEEPEPDDGPDDAAPVTVEDRFPRVDWKTAFATDFSIIDWLPGRILERGQQAALVGPGKAGKSIFVQYWIYCAITGRSFLGDERRPPLNVLYFDRENNIRDIVTRMIAFGASPEDLDRLDYRLFPKFSGSLDQSNLAAAELIAIVDEHPRDLVVFDTVSRFITGKENDADTWLQFYGRVHAPLKGRGIAGLRLDHMGKDEDRGARGNSAKSQDVDHVWELTRISENKTFDPSTGIEHITTGLKLNRTHTRSGLGEDLFLITRRGQRRKGGLWVPGGTSHQLTTGFDADAGPEPGTPEWIADELDKAGVPTEWGGRRIAVQCQEMGIRAAKSKIEEAVRIRKLRASEDVPPNVPYSSVMEMSPDPRGRQDVFPGQASPGDVQGTSGDAPVGVRPPTPPTEVGGRTRGTPECTVCGNRLDAAWHAQGHTTHTGCQSRTTHHPATA